MAEPIKEKSREETVQETLTMINTRVEMAKRDMSFIEAAMERQAEFSDHMAEAASTAAVGVVDAVTGFAAGTAGPEQNGTVKSAVATVAEVLQSVASLELQKSGRLRNEQLILSSFPTYCRRALVQLAIYRKTEADVDNLGNQLESLKGTKQKLAQAEFDANVVYREKAQRKFIQESSEFEGMRCGQIRKVVGDWCHLNMQYHARALSKYSKLMAEVSGEMVAVDIESVVGMMEGDDSRPEAHVAALFVDGLDAIRSRVPPPDEEEEDALKEQLYKELVAK